MLSALLSSLLSLAASVGALSVLAGVVSGIVLLVDTALHWASAQRISLEPGCVVAGGRALLSTAGATTAATAVDGVAHHGNGRAVAVDPGPPTVPAGVPLQTLKLKSSRPRSTVGDGESRASRHTMGEADGDIHHQYHDDDVHHHQDDVRGGVAGVRQLMERLVESLVSGGLDDVVLRPKNPHPQYGRIYKRHQPRLRSALTDLSYSLQMAMAQKPLEESETPGRAHARLRAIILDLARDVANLDRNPGVGHTVNGSANGDLHKLDVKSDFSNRAYEDILATAIVNKVMERSSSKSNRRNNNNNFVSSLEVRLGSVEDSPESCTSSYTESWTSSGQPEYSSEPSQDDVDSDPLSLMIEECIEEVTTITGTSSSSGSSSLDDEESEDGEVIREVPVVRRRRRRSRRRSSGTPASGPPSVLAGLSFLKQRVPFPELGVDIVDADWSSGESQLSDVDVPDAPEVPPVAPGSRNGSEAGSDTSMASCLELVTPLQSWEDNWLFQSRRGRKPAAQYAHHPVPVPMLVPNPSEDFRALIGDVDAEETSDLSECSDDALEEVVLAGMRTNNAHAQGRQHDDDLAADLTSSDLASDPLSDDPRHLDGLAETCNLELLRRVAAPALSTAPAPRAQRTERTANTENARVDSPPRTSPRTSSRKVDPTKPSPMTTPEPILEAVPEPLAEDLSGRWGGDQDAEVTIVYDTPSRREAPKGNGVADGDPETPPTSPTPCPRPRNEPVESPEPDWTSQQVEAHGTVNGNVDPTAAVKLDEDLDDVDLFMPPRPGSIAEREHRKWLEATPLANNPYSPENIQRRLQQRANLHRLPASGTNADHAVDTVINSNGDASLHIALRVDPDPKKYGRDFYINSRSNDQPSSNLRRSQSTTLADRRVGHLDAPIAPWSSAVRTNGDGGSAETLSQCTPSATPSATPSVRELAKQFLPQDESSQSRTRSASTMSPAASQPKVVIVTKEEKAVADPAVDGAIVVPRDVLAAVKDNKKAVRQVHSLTARSMSREFREGLRHLAGAPRPTPATQTQPQPQPERPEPEGARIPGPADLE